jgi:hypothetical protein
MEWKDVPEATKAVANIAWPLIVLILALCFRGQLTKLVEAIRTRVEAGAAIKFFSFELKDFRGTLVKSTAQLGVGDDISSPLIKLVPAAKNDFDERQKIRYESDFVRLVHTVWLDAGAKHAVLVSVYVKIEAPDSTLDNDKIPGRLNSINYVRYYLGKYFGSPPYGDWFEVKNSKDGFAIKYYAVDEINCCAEVYFHGRPEPVKLYRFLDLEPERLLKASAPTASP